MKKQSTAILFLLLLAACVIMGVYMGQQIHSDRSVEYDYAADLASVADYEPVLRVAGGSDFSPFAYLDENGLPCGRDVELAFALGRELGCRIEVTLGDWTEMQTGLLDGTYDILLTVDYSDERSQIMGYTSPVCVDSYVFFGKSAGLDVSDLGSMKNLKIAALAGGGATDNYLSPMGLLENTTFYDTQAAAFQSVEDGENDLAIAGYIYGSNIISSLGMSLRQVGTPLYGSAYYFTYNISNTELGPRLNAALASLEACGIMDQIEEKWTTHYQPNLTLREYLAQNRQDVLTIALIVVLLLVILAAVLYDQNSRREKALMEQDQLTGLYHMRSFMQRAGQLLQKRADTGHVLIRFDLDNFKAYNSTQGTERGDALLKGIGGGLKKLQEDRQELILVGYLGADHFALLAEREPVERDPEALYQALDGMVRQACAGYCLSIRMGICALEDEKEDLGQCCDWALLALRSVKNNYYQHLAWFDDAIRSRQAEEKQITDHMFQALEQGCFVPYFQPQYDYSTGTICGAEALARWVDEERGLISPGAFIPVFEKNGFVYAMDQAIWRACCRYMRTWKQEGLSLPPISVNISRTDLYHTDLVETLQQITAQEGVGMQELHLEITESAYLENSSLLIDTVSRLRQLGARVEMDDFGSGYSSLSALKDMDFDTIKLDMSLLHNNSLAGKHAALLSAIIGLARSLGLELIAEGVEYTQQADYLHSLGCDRMQGFLFSKPLPPEEFAGLLRRSALGPKALS